MKLLPPEVDHNPNIRIRPDSLVLIHVKDIIFLVFLFRGANTQIYTRNWPTAQVQILPWQTSSGVGWTQLGVSLAVRLRPPLLSLDETSGGKWGKSSLQIPTRPVLGSSHLFFNVRMLFTTGKIFNDQGAAVIFSSSKISHFWFVTICLSQPF